MINLKMRSKVGHGSGEYLLQISIWSEKKE